jgi:hypothetical protein
MFDFFNASFAGETQCGLCLLRLFLKELQLPQH